MSNKRAKRRTNPFVGPRPFLPGEPLFGRDREISELRNLLVAERIVALYSPSGAGKTSLVQAGLIPKMQESGFHVLPVIRVNQPPIGANDGSTNRYLESALRSLDEHLSEAEQQTSDDIDHLRLADYLVNRPRPADTPATDLLIFDQFEEILTLDPTDGDAKTEFFTQVGEALRGEERWALFSFREDHLAGLDPFLPLIPTRLATSFRLEFLSREAAVEAIQGTASEGGVEFTEEAAEQLVTDLSRVRVQQPDRSVEERPGPDIEPVQLQVVCHRLWNQLADDRNQIDLELVKTHGDVSDALGGFYAESIAAVAKKTSLPERALRAWFDEHLITKQGIRGQVVWELGQSTGLSDAAIRELIDTHLVRAESRRGATWLELAHDRLIDPVRANNDAWYQANLNALQQQARLWQSQDRAPGYLLAGEALTQAEQWAADNPGSLAAIDREFLDDSLDQRKLQDAERRDLEAAQRLAKEAQARQQAEEAARREAEQRVSEQAVAATKARRWLWVTAAVATLAMIAAVVSFVFYRQTQAAREEAEVQRNTAVALATTVASERQRADEQIQRYTIERLADEVPDQVAQRQDELAALLARQAFLQDEAAGGVAPAATNQAFHEALGVPYFSRILPGQEGVVNVVAFSPNGQFMVSGGTDGTIRFWNLKDPAPAAPTLLPGPEPESPIRSLAFSPDGQDLATGSGDGKVRLWHLEGSAEPVILPTGSELPVRSVAFSPDGKRLASGSGDGRVRLWKLADLSAEPVVLTRHEGPVITIAFSPDGQKVASGSGDATVQVWDLADPHCSPVLLEGHEDSVQSVTFIPDEMTLASGSDDSIVRLWKLTESAPAAAPVVLEHEAAVQSVAFSPDGKTLASGSSDDTVQLWDLANLTTEPVVLGHEDAVQSVVFSPDGKTLVSGSDDGSVRLWDLTDAEPADPVVLSGHVDPVQSVAFSPDGKFLASGSADGSVRLWDRDATSATSNILDGDDGSVSTERLSELVCDMVGRSLSLEEWRQFVGAETPYVATCPNLPDGRLIEARELAAAGDREQAAKAYENATALAVATPNAALNSEICASGVDDTFAQIVLPACERAVELAPGDSGVRDRRGLARALTGDAPGAIADFASVAARAEEGGDPALIEERQEWMAALLDGRNPFDDETLRNRSRIDTPPVSPPDLTGCGCPGCARDVVLNVTAHWDPGRLQPRPSAPIDHLKHQAIEDLAEHEGRWLSRLRIVRLCTAVGEEAAASAAASRQGRDP